MSHSLGLRIVAEGVEDAEVLERLKSMGCDLGQGFHRTPGLPAEDFLSFLKDQPAPVGRLSEAF
jgi:diguanylate cyclase